LVKELAKAWPDGRPPDGDEIPQSTKIPSSRQRRDWALGGDAHPHAAANGAVRDEEDEHEDEHGEEAHGSEQPTA
jgi:hypothetical protein